MKLSLQKEVEDVRGKIIFLNFGKKNFHIVETKKGFARGGHYHTFPSHHIIISGSIEYREKNLAGKQETIKKIQAPETIKTMPNIAHLIIALEDTVFIESFEQPYQAINFDEYRKIVEEKMKES